MNDKLKFSEYKYKRINVDEMTEKMTKAIESMDSSRSKDEYLKFMKEYLKLEDHVETMFTLAKIRHALNVHDEFYEEENRFKDENSPKFKHFKNQFYMSLVNSKFKEDVVLEYGEHIINLANIFQRTYSDSIMEDLVSENKLISKYGKELTSLKMKFRGEEKNISGIFYYMSSSDRDTRIEAYKSFDEALFEKRHVFDEIFDELVKLRDSMAKKLGYENFIPLGYARMKRSDYGPKSVGEFRSHIKKYIVPLAKEIILKQAVEIEVDSIKIFDENILFKDGNAVLSLSENEIVDKATEMYDLLSKETSEFFSFMKSHELMDLKSKEGKKFGGFCTLIPDYRVPFIYGNFNGSSDDVDILTHEAGHAFQMYRSSSFDLPDYRFPTLDSCEIHSMSMEFLTYTYMEMFFKEDTHKFLYAHMSENIKFMPYAALIDDFQHFVYENPKASIEERNEYYKKKEGEYLPYRDYDGLKYFESGRFWQKQGHLFTDPMYYIDYALALVIALQLYKEFTINKETALNKYIKLCDLGGSESFLRLIESSSLMNPFEEKTFDFIVEEIKKSLTTLNKLKTN